MNAHLQLTLRRSNQMSEVSGLAARVSSGRTRLCTFQRSGCPPKILMLHSTRPGTLDSGDLPKGQPQQALDGSRGTPTLALLLPDMRGGGAERVALNLALGFAQRGHAVDLVLLQATGALLDAVPVGVRVVDLGVHRIRGLLVPLVRYLRRERPAAMLVSMWPLTALAVLARRLSGVKTRLVLSEHTTWSQAELLQRPGVAWQVRTSMRWLFPGADAVVCVSRGAADDLARFTGLDRNTLTAIHNPVSGQQTAVATGACGPAGWWLGPNKRVLAVGALKGEKDYPTLLRAFARLRQTTDARLLVLGEGVCRPALEALVRELGLNDAVDLPGFVANPAPCYRHADLHVLSSVAEGFGNVIVEALEAGIPVVSTDCPCGPAEILDGGRYGRLVPMRDPEALARAMAAALAEAPDRQALRARAAEFSVDRAVDRYAALLFPQPAGTGHPR